METIFFKTESGNRYLYSPKFKVFLPVSDSSDELRQVLDSYEYTEPFEGQYDGFITAEDIRFSLSNIPQVIFEVTSACNLRCEYCCYGQGYDTFKNRKNGNLDFKYAKAILDFLYDRMNENSNASTNTPFVISFYGGEPLLNIKVIEQIVSYAKAKNFPNRILNFSLTTNATHLFEYIDFLKDNDFHLLISLDGDRLTNRHRRLADGSESYGTVIQNLNMVRAKYPDYFKTIRYNAVFSDYSNVDNVLSFFKKTFDMVPTISPLHEPDKDAPEYDAVKRMVNQVGIPHNVDLENEAVIQIPLHKRIADFLFKMTRNFYTTELDYLMKGDIRKYPTATCIPFSRRIFVTTHGELLPCEKICRDTPYGIIKDNKVVIDYEKLARRHNSITYSNVKQCEKCYLRMCCNQCAHNFKNGVCSSFKDKEQFSILLSELFSYIELHPEIRKLIEEKIVLR